MQRLDRLVKDSHPVAQSGRQLLGSHRLEADQPGSQLERPLGPWVSVDVAVQIGVDKTSVKQGEQLTYTITVHNFGPDAAANVVVNDALSSGTTFVSAQANKGTFTKPPVGQTGTVTWAIGNMQSADEEAAQIKVTVLVKGKTTVTNTATVSSDSADPNPANNTASITVSVAAGTTGKKK